MTLQAFIDKYTGVAGVGNTRENTGECVGLVMVWTASKGLPHTWGHAKDLLANADRNAFQVIANSETNHPQPGDVLCWNGRWGGGYGHTGIVVSADASTFTLFEQNNPTGSRPRLVKHANYSNVQGWMRPINNQGGEVKEIADYNYVNWVAQVCFFRVMPVEEFNQWHQNKTKLAVWEEFTKSDEGTKKREEIGATYAQRDRLVVTISDLTTQAQTQQKTITELNAQIRTLQTAPKPVETTPVVQPPTSTTPTAPAIPAAPSDVKATIQHLLASDYGKLALQLGGAALFYVIDHAANFGIPPELAAAVGLALGHTVSNRAATKENKEVL